MAYDYEYMPLEMETDEFETGYEELETDSEELEAADFEFETGARVQRIVPYPRIGDKSAFQDDEADEFEFAQELDQEIFLPDTRKVVTDTTKVPFRFICHLSIGYESEDRKVQGSGTASGTLIGRLHVLTCGHALKIKMPNGTVLMARKITVTPGRNSAHAKHSEWKPFGSVGVKSFKAHDNWVKSFDFQYDFGLLTLKSDIGGKKFRSLGNKPLGCWGATGGTSLTPLDPATLAKKLVNMGGYPGDKCGADPKSAVKSCARGKDSTAQFVAYDEVIDPKPPGEPHLIYHKADLKAGQSGAPLWRWEKATGKRYLVGIQSTETANIAADGTRTPLRNSAVRVTAKMMDDLKKWGWVV